MLEAEERRECRTSRGYAEKATELPSGIITDKKVPEPIDGCGNNTDLEISGKKPREVQIRNFVETIREMDAPITEFDSGLWCGLVDCVTVYSRDNIKVKFKDGTEI